MADTWYQKTKINEIQKFHKSSGYLNLTTTYVMKSKISDTAAERHFPATKQRLKIQENIVSNSERNTELPCSI